jgi:predicted homoserine dehydrogenase-like protein
MLYQELAALESKGRPIRVGVSGAGWIGSGFVAQVSHVPGMQVSVLADADTRAAKEAFLATGVGSEDIVEAESPGAAEDALRAGKRVITGSYALAAQLEDVDIVADVTPSPRPAQRPPGPASSTAKTSCW